MKHSVFVLIVGLCLSAVAQADRIRDVEQLTIGQTVNFVPEIGLKRDGSEPLVSPATVEAVEKNKVTLKMFNGEIREVALGEFAGPGELWTVEDSLYVDSKRGEVSKTNSGFGIEVRVGDVVAIETGRTFLAFPQTTEALIVAMTNRGDATFQIESENGVPELRGGSLTKVGKVLQHRVAPTATADACLAM